MEAFKEFYQINRQQGEYCYYPYNTIYTVSLLKAFQWLLCHKTEDRLLKTNNGTNVHHRFMIRILHLSLKCIYENFVRRKETKKHI